MRKNKELGEQGEQMAADYLKKNGWHLLELKLSIQPFGDRPDCKKGGLIGVFRSENPNQHHLWDARRFCGSEKG
jgi:hypothetical protein